MLATAEALAVSRFAATGFSLSVLSARPELLKPGAAQVSAASGLSAE